MLRPARKTTASTNTFTKFLRVRMRTCLRRSGCIRRLVHENGQPGWVLAVGRSPRPTANSQRPTRYSCARRASHLLRLVLLGGRGVFRRLSDNELADVAAGVAVAPLLRLRVGHPVRAA